MKKKMIFRSLLLFVFLATHLTLPSAVIASPGGPENTVESCPAPPPTNLTVVYVTPTSIALAWISAAPGLYHKLETYDLTSSTWLPTVYLGAESYTASGLTPGHCYRFYLSSSYCSGGPYGSSVNVDGCTAIIITETIVELQNPPSPTSWQKSGAGSVHSFCIDLSTTSTEPFTNGFVGQFVYQDYQGNHPLQFAAAVLPTGDEVHIGPTSTSYSGYSFVYPNGNPSQVVKCKYGWTDIFTAEVTMSGNSPVVSEAHISLTFNSTCTNYYFGGAVTCSNPSFLPGTEPSDGEEVSSANSEQRSEVQAVTQLRPNPFSHSTTLDYWLDLNGPVLIQLYDGQGRFLRTIADVQAEPGLLHFTIPGEGIPAGVYFIAVQSAGGREVFPLVRVP